MMTTDPGKPAGPAMEPTVYPESRLLAWIAPSLLFLLTTASTVFAGGWAFGLPMMAILLGHSLGHHLVGRRFGVVSSLPYCVPQISLSGTSGAYIKVKWPIEDRNTLLAMFLAGPLLGISVSVLFLVIGLSFSKVIASPDEDTIMLGEPLLMKFFTGLFFPGLTTDQDVILSPTAFAGWVGILANFWQLLPILQIDR